MKLMNEYADHTATETDGLAEFRCELDRLEREWRDANEKRDIDAMEAVDRKIERLRGDYYATHPEYWAETQIDALKREWELDHPGATLAGETSEMQWYRDEARRRRARLDQTRTDDGRGLL